MFCLPFQVHLNSGKDMQMTLVQFCCKTFVFFYFYLFYYPMHALCSKGQSHHSGSLAVWQSVCGHNNEHFERIRNACSFLLQWMGSKLKEKNARFTNKNHTKGCEKQGFSLSVQIIKQKPTPISIFHTCYIYSQLKEDTISKQICCFE